jgi:hypothetical protein
MPKNPNLSRRPAKPALNRGRVQRGALRALWASLNGEATTSEVAEWTHARARAYGELSDNHTRAARRVLALIAGSYTVAGNVVRVEDAEGRSLGSQALRPGDDPKAVARAILRTKKTPTAFDAPLPARRVYH